MIWKIKDKETVIKKKFAFLPKRIGDYVIWLSRYYMTYDLIRYDGSWTYVPHYFLSRRDCEDYVDHKYGPKASVEVN